MHWPGWHLCCFTLLTVLPMVVPFCFHLPLTSCSSSTFLQLLRSRSNLRLIKMEKSKERLGSK